MSGIRFDMSRLIEKMRDESLREGVLRGAHAKAIESAKRLLAAGKLSYQKLLMQWACPLKKLRRWTLSNQPEMVETMCRVVRKIGHERNKLVKAWDPDFTKATPLKKPKK